MKATVSALRDRLRTQLADLKMPGALEAVDGILQQVDGGQLSAPAAIEAVLGAHIALRNARRLQTAASSTSTSSSAMRARTMRFLSRTSERHERDLPRTHATIQRAGSAAGF